MKSLFLVDEREVQDRLKLEMLRTLKKDDDTVLSLSTLTSLALRRMAIPFVTPDLFYSHEKCPAIDKQAVTFSKNWYRPVDSSLMSFRGISIGEILEFDFYHLFVDALRSVEIANTLVRDSFDVIYFPSFDSSIGFGKSSFHSMCYQTLPPILADLASQSGIGIAGLKPVPSRAVEVDRIWGSRGLLDFAISSAMFMLRNYRDLAILLSNEDLSRFALANTIDDSVIKDLRGTGGRGLKAYPSFMNTRRSKLHASNTLNVLRSEQVIAKLDESIVYDHIHLWRSLFPMVDRVLSRLIPLVVGRIVWTEWFARVFRPSSFVVSEDITPLPRSMCQVLKNQGIPIVVVQHGILTEDMGGMYLMPVVGHRQAVWGEFYKQWHTKRGKSSESQVVTGFPRHDELFHMPPLDRERLCRRFRLNPEIKVVLVATEWFEGASSRYTIEQHEKYIRLVLSSLRVHDDIQIVVKLHPSFQSEFRRIVSEIAEEVGVEIVVAKDSLWDLIRLSAFVIVAVSSVCVEALLLGKPVISVDVTDDKDISGLVMNGLAMGAHSTDEFNQAVRICMRVDEQGKFEDIEKMRLLSPFVFLADGCSSRRVAELVRTVSLQNPTLRQQ